MDDANENIKIVFVGWSGAGRTVLIKRYIDNYFDNTLPSTNGASYSSKNLCINKKQLTLHIWDTAGQEKFRALIRNFVKDAKIICIAYDITNKYSFEEIKDYWSHLALEMKEKFTVIAIVGCKSDLYKYEEVDNEEVEEFAKEIHAIFMLTTSTQQYSVDLFFETIVKKYLESKQNDGYYSIDDIYSGFEDYSKNLPSNKKNKKFLCLKKYISY